MAKKQNKLARDRESVASSARKVSIESNGQSSRVTKTVTTSKQTRKSSTATHKRNLSQDEIGKVAGEVWQTLADQGQQSLATVKKAVDAPSDLVLAATGWLAREGKLDFSASGRSVKVSLR